MKLPDSEQLANYEYLIVNDQWKQEWERGVQVPVNPDSLPEPYVEVLPEPIVTPARDFKLLVFSKTATTKKITIENVILKYIICFVLDRKIASYVLVRIIHIRRNSIV